MSGVIVPISLLEDVAMTQPQPTKEFDLSRLLHPAQSYRTPMDVVRDRCFSAPSTSSKRLFYSGNDSAAKAGVAVFIDWIGFVGIDLGSLAVGGKLAQFPGGPLPNQNLVKVG
jgi:hypothetical protein